MGNKIMTRAKSIYKQHPKKKWTDCVAQAAKQLKGKTTTHKKKKKSMPSKSKGRSRKTPVAGSPRKRTTPASLLKQVKKKLDDQLGQQAVKHFHAKKKSQKNKIGKQLNLTKRKLRSAVRMLSNKKKR